MRTNNKRWAIALVLILTIAGGGIFALDLGNGLEVTGGVNTGVSVNTAVNTAGDYATTVSPYSADEDGTFGVNVAFRYTAGAGGFAFKLANSGTPAATVTPPATVTGAIINYVKFPYAYGWINFLQGDIITLYGGAIDGALWGTTSGNVLDKSSDAITGVRLAVKPIAGLSLGFSLPFSNGALLEDNLKEILFGVAYEADLFKVHATLDLVDPSWVVPNADSAIAILFSATVTPIEALAIDFDLLYRTEAFAYNNYADLNGAPRDQLAGFKGLATGLRATYTAGPLSAYGKFVVSTSDKDNVIAGNWTIPYDIGDITDPKDPFALSVELGASYQVIPALTAKLSLGTDNALFIAGKDYSGTPVPGTGLWVKIGGSVPIDGGFGLSFYDKISGIVKKGDNQIVNEVNLSLTWSF